jgi:hypothetical protein
MENQMVPVHQVFATDGPKGITESVHLGFRCAAGVAGVDSMRSNRLRDSSSGFSVRVDSLSLFREDISGKAAEV